MARPLPPTTVMPVTVGLKVVEAAIREVARGHVDLRVIADQRRLRDMLAIRRLGEAALLGDGKEHLELPDVHGPPHGNSHIKIA